MCVSDARIIQDVILTLKYLEYISKKSNLPKKDCIYQFRHTGEFNMISSNYDINEFIASLRNRDYLDIIFLANREATEAERIVLHSGFKIGKKEQCAKDYADELKELIFFLRSTIVPKKTDMKFEQLSKIPPQEV
jgi:hypothetical protein